LIITRLTWSTVTRIING